MALRGQRGSVVQNLSDSDLISVVVTTYNRSDALLRVLEGLATQNSGGNYEVVVADDGSRLEHVTAVLSSPAAKSLRLRHVWHPDVGFTAALVRNLGALQTGGRYLVFLDGDCVPLPDFVHAHRRLAERGWLVSGSRVLCSERWTRQLLSSNEPRQSLDVTTLDWVGRRFRGDINKLTHLLHLPDAAWRKRRARSWHGIRSCNLAIWRDDFAAVDGFDASFAGWGHEDADLVVRLLNHGVRRKDGACATEVLHLWHVESDRSHASPNAARVSQRCQDATTSAERGLRTTADTLGVRVTQAG